MVGGSEVQDHVAPAPPTSHLPSLFSPSCSRPLSVSRFTLTSLSLASSPFSPPPHSITQFRSLPASAWPPSCLVFLFLHSLFHFFPPILQEASSVKASHINIAHHKPIFLFDIPLCAQLIMKILQVTHCRRIKSSSVSSVTLWLCVSSCSVKHQQTASLLCMHFLTKHASSSEIILSNTI